MGCCGSKEDFVDEPPRRRRHRSKRKDKQSPSAERTSKEQPSPIFPPKKVGRDIYVAIFRYEPGSPSEVALEKRDRVEILSTEEGGFAFVRQLKIHGTRGYVPVEFLALENSVESENYFYGACRRRDAIKALNVDTLPAGSFLVRIGEKHTSDSEEMELSRTEERYTGYVLSVKDGQTPPVIHHYRIRSASTEHKVYIRQTNMFDKVQDLITFYKNNLPGTDICCKLTESPVRPTPVRKELSKEMRERWREIPREQIELQQPLGEGKFGTVFKALWKTAGAKPVEVVAKCLKAGALTDKQLLLDEASTMKDLCHENVVKLYGVVSSGEPYYIITEFVKDGSLKDYLQKRIILRLATLPQVDLLDICAQICRGMEFLASKHVVHRDLATRNVLLDVKTEKPFVAVVKIADFGLARALNETEVYKMKTATYLPIKWLAPEAFTFKFSTQTDVWAFGVVLYEIFTNGEEPFSGFDDEQVRRSVLGGAVPEKPSEMPKTVYEMMRKCCKRDPSQRPTFTQLYADLDGLLKSCEAKKQLSTR